MKHTFLLAVGIVSSFLISNPAYAGAAAEEKTRFALEQLTEGGYVVFFRHAARDKIPSQSKLWELDRRSLCQPGGELNIKGLDESNQISKKMNQLNIESSEVYVSPTCRTKQMARILFGDDFVITKEISPPWVRNSKTLETDQARLRDLLNLPIEGEANRFLFSHSKVLTEQVVGRKIPLGQTDAAVFKPSKNSNGENAFEFLGIIPKDDWLR